MKIKKNTALPRGGKTLVSWPLFYLCFVFGDDVLQMFLEPIKLDNTINSVICFVIICIVKYLIL